jgi:hypothetical protein
MPLLIGAAAGGLLSAGMGAYKMFKGGKQEEAGRKAKASLIKPQYQIPEEIKQNLKESELRALEGLPAAQKAEYVKNLQRGQERALQAQADRKGGLLGIQAATQQATDAFTNLTSMDAAARAANQQQLQQNRMIMAQEKGKQYAERRGDYQQDLDSANAMIGAGSQNKMTGLDQMAGTALTLGTSMLGSGIGGGAKAAGAGAGLGSTGTGSSNNLFKTNIQGTFQRGLSNR